MRKEQIKGGYFVYCQWCRRDTHCRLRHCQFMGAKPAGQIDRTPYPSHEDLSYGLTAFQQKPHRAACNGLICKTGSIFYPLVCQCGTAISSLTLSSALNLNMCAKFQPNEKGKERIKIAQDIAKKRKIDLSDVSPEGLPEADPNYVAIMNR